MTGPATPGQEGPSFAPPPLPEGWIAQWDGMSKKYYFVQLSTGASQWDTPTHAAPTGPTPQATPQAGLEHPYGTPDQQLDIVTNPDGSQSIRHPDGSLEPYTTDRSLSGNIGQFAMNQLLGGGKKPNNQSGGGLGALAGQFLGGGSSHNQNTHSSGGSIVSALAGQILGGGKKPDQAQNYAGGQSNQQSHGSGMIGSLGSMFGGHSSSSQGNTYGYSSHNDQQGGYSGSAPPTSYQPSGTAHTQYNPPPLNQYAQHANSPQSQSQSYNQTPQQSYSQNQPQSQSYNSPQPYGAPPNSQPGYGTPSNAQQPSYGGIQHQDTYGQQSQPYASPPSQQSPYGAPPNNQQPSYGGPLNSQQPPFGGIQHQDTYGGHQGAPSLQQYPPPPSYPGGSGYGGPAPPSGNLSQPQHQHFQGMHNAEHSGGLYGNSGPPIPTGSHPYQGQNGPPPPQYGAPPNQYGGPQRW
ncbi:hypothetical protein L207DRAFT_513505 [Hyaloscypha variabilis F]|uniref:WW domain-containing protein n=1 Tax=Hyaloscypha variabilis (strain UAMH 11265 / GT02V1 / F) TaxID=1149755 RepID=A0A2J6RKG2_HYAVF|nr:hypothetical protein L207DRAFT_513505 [Hyaloscypha variabilis F]